jgi:TonB family protein
MGTVPQAQSWDRPCRRKTVRRALHLAIEATVLRAGIPDTLPGRALNLSQGGLAAALAGELLAGEAVAIEIPLPTAVAPLRARAVVKYCANLHSGMEFVALSPEQRAMIVGWAKSVEPPMVEQKLPSSTLPNSPPPQCAHSPIKRRGSGKWIWLAAILLAALATLAWWNWNREWNQLEAGITKDEAALAPVHPQLQVSGDVMQKLVKHRVDPEYPAAARSENLHAIIVLDVVIGPDGSVLDVHARNGPEMLAQAAVEAMRWWRFEPYRVDGQPVVVETTVAMEFNP